MHVPTPQNYTYNDCWSPARLLLNKTYYFLTGNQFPKINTVIFKKSFNNASEIEERFVNKRLLKEGIFNNTIPLFLELKDCLSYKKEILEYYKEVKENSNTKYRQQIDRNQKTIDKLQEELNYTLSELNKLNK